MEQTNRIRKIIAAVAVGIVVAVCVAGGIVYWKAKPYLELKKTIEFLKTQDYFLEADYSIEGGTLPLGDLLRTGTLSGQKAGDIISGEVTKEEQEYLEIYADQSGECMFNIRPLFGVFVSFLPDSLSQSIPDTYVSLKQLREITQDDQGESSDSESGDESGESAFFLNRILKDFSSEYGIKRLEPSEEYEYFQVTSAENDFVCQIGIPRQDENRIYLKMEQNGMTVEADISYEQGDVETVEMPGESFSEQTIQIFKTVYRMWKSFNNK